MSETRQSVDWFFMPYKTCRQVGTLWTQPVDFLFHGLQNLSTGYPGSRDSTRQRSSNGYFFETKFESLTAGHCHEPVDRLVYSLYNLSTTSSCRLLFARFVEAVDLLKLLPLTCQLVWLCAVQTCFVSFPRQNSNLNID